jgi:hypothetical protein
MASGLTLRILDAAQLRQEHALLASLTDLVNETYREIDAPGSFARLPTQDALWREFGRNGFCVILQDPGRGDLPVAITGAKRWKKERKDDDEINNAGLIEPEPSWPDEWEIGPVATRKEPQYRRKGLIDRCLASLYRALLEESGGGGQTGEVTLWMKVEEGIRIGYWTKKGFRQVGPWWSVPVGEWHTDLGFRGIDMRKTISRGYC